MNYECQVAETLKVEETLLVEEEFEPSPPGLQELPPNWKYVFLGEDSKQPVILSSLLTPLEEDDLVKELEKDYDTSTWNLNGIIPAFWLHKVYKEEEVNPGVGACKIVIPPLECLVKKEVTKLVETVMMSFRKKSVDDSKEGPKGARKKKRKKGRNKQIKFIRRPIIVKSLLVDQNNSRLKKEQKRSWGETSLKYPP
ncbi:unnamed protein product [Trifolium pratense]|uniref:Uncharacterized protein n=1 Tax=Trifolium pratense TaxID=57577 RepID=A0ACB0JKX4_TRIPR|nr:unnamed protein product [Trifolium pratense]